MAGVRFEDVDLLGALSRIVDLHTQHYKEDFDLDKELISKLAVSERSEDKQLLWMSRPSGTVGSHWRSSVPHLLQTKKVKYSLITTLVNIPELIRRGVFYGIKLDGILADEIGTSC